MSLRAKKGGPARYQEIAADLAREVALGRLPEGSRVFGRSSLAGRYGVSPETIRRSLALLQERGIVRVQAGVGVVVLSARAAQEYLTEFGRQRLVEEARQRLDQLARERDRINLEIEDLLAELLDYVQRLSVRYQHLQEVRVPDGSALDGVTLAESHLRSEVGALVLSVRRGKEEVFAPPPSLEIEAGDILVLVAPLEGEAALNRLLSHQEPPGPAQAHPEAGEGPPQA